MQTGQRVYSALERKVKRRRAQRANKGRVSRKRIVAAKNRRRALLGHH